MKFLTGRQLLHQAASLPLVEVNADDVETALNSNLVKHRTSAATNKSSGSSASQLTDCSTSAVFRKPSPPHGFCHTPVRNRHRLINLSFSQPSSPRSPCLSGKKKAVYATPYVQTSSKQGSHHDSFVPPTPMIVSSIEALNCTMANVDVLGIIPDILEIIDDETHQTDSVDRQLKLLTETELSDETVVEYLLDLSQEVKPKQSHQINHQDFHPERGQVRRKSRYTKLMSEEERETLKHIQREKSKQRRKQRFKEPPVTGTRRSKRIRQPVRSYMPSTQQ